MIFMSMYVQLNNVLTNILVQYLIINHYLFVVWFFSFICRNFIVGSAQVFCMQKFSVAVLHFVVEHDSSSFL